MADSLPPKKDTPPGQTPPRPPSSSGPPPSSGPGQTPPGQTPPGQTLPPPSQTPPPSQAPPPACPDPPTFKQSLTELVLATATASLHNFAQWKRLSLGLGDHLLGHRGAAGAYLGDLGELSRTAREQLRALFATEVSLVDKVSTTNGVALTRAVGAILRGLDQVDPLPDKSQVPGGSRDTASLLRALLEQLRKDVATPPPIRARVVCTPHKGGSVTVELSHRSADDVLVTFSAGPLRHVGGTDEVAVELHFHPRELVLRPGAREAVTIEVPWDERLRPQQHYRGVVRVCGLEQRIELEVGVP